MIKKVSADTVQELTITYGFLDGTEGTPPTAEELIDQTRDPFVRWPVAGAVDQAQHFAGLGQCQNRRVVTPQTVVGDVHAGLALADGPNQ